MSINVPVDEQLLKEAVSATGESNAEKLLELALKELLEKRRRRPIDAMLDLVGDVRLRDDYDYKAMRIGKRDPD